MSDPQTPRDVIARLCALQSRVAERVFRWRLAADCVCRPHDADTFRSDEEVLRWIEDRVAEAIVAHERLPGLDESETDDGWVGGGRHA